MLFAIAIHLQHWQSRAAPQTCHGLRYVVLTVGLASKPTGPQNALHQALFAGQIRRLMGQREGGVVAANPLGRGFQAQEAMRCHGCHDLRTKAARDRRLVRHHQPPCLVDRFLCDVPTPRHYLFACSFPLSSLRHRPQRCDRSRQFFYLGHNM